MTTTRSVQSSELSRNTREVLHAADEGPILVKRRDGEDLVLASRRDVDNERLGVELASLLVAVSLAPGEQAFTQRLAQAFPWMEFLTQEDRADFATEVVEVARACAAVSRYQRLLITLQAWQDSAEAIAAGYGRHIDWLDDDEMVPDPRA